MEQIPRAAFFILWAGGFIAHFDQLSEWFSHPLITTSVALSALAICFPKSTPLLLLSFCFQILACWLQMPLVDNHWFAVAFINALWLILVSIHFVRSPSKDAFTHEVWAEAIPIIRILVMMIYGFAVFYKLNADYFSDDLSCAISFYEKLKDLPFLPYLPNLGSGLLRQWLPTIIWVWEFGILFFLLWRRTWALGISLGVGFHILTSAYLRHFPSVMFPLYLLFIPPSVLKMLSEDLHRHASRFFGRFTGTRMLQIYGLVWPALFIASATIAYLSGISPNDSALRWLILRLWSIFLIVIFSFSATLVIRKKLWRIPLQSSFRIKRLWHLIFPLLFAINALSPILGLKTSTSFAMWSNLAVNNTSSNHWFFPQGPIHLFPFMKNYLKIVSTNSPSFNEDLLHQTQIPLFSLQRRITRLEALNPDRPHALEVELDGKRLTLNELKQLDSWPLFGKYWIQKIVWIHDFPSDGRGLCRW